MPTQRDTARAAVGDLLKTPFNFVPIGALRSVLTAADRFRSNQADGSIDVDLWHDLVALVNACDAAARALERIKLRAAGKAPSTASYDQ